MSLYNEDDVKLLSENIERIKKEVDKEVLVVLEPKLQEMKEVQNIILSYIKSKKRKIYGGYAMNILIGKKNPKDMFYDPDEQPPDVDFYSPEPIQDLINICNILEEKKYKYVKGQEAQHSETYNIFVNLHKDPYCDISYTPKNIYNKMPYEEINGFMIIHPHFMSIDYFRMLNDPLLSYWRIEKSFKRFSLLLKHYPLPHNNNKYLDFGDMSPDATIGLDIIYKFLLNKTSTLTVGFYAYNYFLQQSKLKDKNIKQLQVPYYEIVSANYVNDCLELLDELKKNVIISKKISHQEYTRFFQFTGYAVEIYIEDELIALIYDNNKKCFPYLDVPSINFSDNKTNTNQIIRLGTFNMCMMYNMINIMRSRIFGDKDAKELYYTTVSHLIDMRKYYFDKNKKNFLDDTLFKDFVVKCVGETIKPTAEKQLKIEQRKKQGKSYSFRYEPSTDKDKGESAKNYVFPNSSGNIITNEKYLKLVQNKQEKKDFSEEEEESEEK